MTAGSRTPRAAHAASPAAGARRQPRKLGRVADRRTSDREGIDRDGRQAVVLRCPGPLVALRGLAALYGVSAQRLATCLPACETHAHANGHAAAGALAAAVRDDLATVPRAPTAVHYFHAARFARPALVLERGLHPAPTTADAVWQHLGEVACSDITNADWAALQPAPDGRHDGPERRLRDAADALQRGPSGSLVCDVVLRPALYGTHDHLALPALVDIAAACEPYLGFDLAQRFAQATTPCVVAYRRRPARDGQDIDAALCFVAAALRGTVSPRATGGHDAHGSPIAAHDIISVRAIGTELEWTASHRTW